MLDDIALYYGWFAYSSRIMYPHMPERVIRQFRYLQVILKDLFMSTPPAMVCRDVDPMYDDLYNHPVPNKARSMVLPRKWGSAFDYI